MSALCPPSYRYRTPTLHSTLSSRAHSTAGAFFSVYSVRAPLRKRTRKSSLVYWMQPFEFILLNSTITGDTRHSSLWLLVIGYWFFWPSFFVRGPNSPSPTPLLSTLLPLAHDVVGSTIPYSRGPVRHWKTINRETLSHRYFSSICLCDYRLLHASDHKESYHHEHISQTSPKHLFSSPEYRLVKRHRMITRMLWDCGAYTNV